MKQWQIKVCRTALLLLAVGITALGNPEFDDAWDWPLPPRLYGALSQGERTQFAGAEKLLRDGKFDAAAVEFEKFLVQNKGTAVRAHALLLQGYSLHLAGKRNTAIARYMELLDTYAESLDQSVPAAFLMGWAHRQNGNPEMAIEAWEQLIANERHLEHALTDRALLELATNDERQKKTRQAEQRLEKIIELFVNAFVRPPKAALEAHARLTRLCIQEGRYPALEALLQKPVPYVKPGNPAAKADYVHRYATEVLKTMQADGQRRFFAWFRDRLPDYERARRQDEYFEKAMQLALAIGAQDDWNALAARMHQYTENQPSATLAQAAERMTRQLVAATQAKWKVNPLWTPFFEMVLKKGEALNTAGQIRLYGGVAGAMPRPLFPDGTPEAVFWDTLIARMTDLYAGMLNPERDEGLASLINRLVGVQRHAHAHRLVDRIESAPFGMQKKAEILVDEKKYAEALATCEAIEASDTGRYAAWALETRATLFAEPLARYADAILLYQQINDPPRTLWAIVACHEKAGAPADAVAVCNEIENFFPEAAPQAAYRKAMIWHQVNDRKQAIAAFRAVLRKYPRHAEAAQAHQMQEKYGFDFGGGVTDEVE